jgi:anti-sigma-K factor RskA
MTAEEAKELIPLYALGALDDADKQEFERKIKELPPETRELIDEWQGVVALLPLALDPHPAPPAVRDRLLTEIGGLTPVTKATVIPLKPVRKTSFDWPRWGLLAASLILAFTSWMLWRENQRLDAEVGSALEQVAALNQQINQERIDFESVAARATRLVLLTGQKVSPKSSARIFWDTEHQNWAMYISDLPSPTMDQEYQLWYITKDQRKISAKVFKTDKSGRGNLRVELPREIATELAAAAVTLEPRGGSVQPTGEIYLLASL